MSLEHPVAGILGLALTAVLSTTLVADEITLKDGSRIVGKIVSMGADILEIETEAAADGTLKVKFSSVQSIVSDDNQTIELQDGSRIVGRPRLDENGDLFLDTEHSGSVPTPLDNVDAINPPEKKAVRQKGNITMNGRVTDGNTRTKAGGATGYYQMRTDQLRFQMAGDWNYAEDSGDLSARNASGRTKFDYFFTPRVFGYTNSLFQGDDFADLNLRTTLGAGIGYQFLDEELDKIPVDFYEEVGVSFFDEDFDNQTDNRYASIRISGKLEWGLIPDKVNFFHFHEIYPGLEDENNVYVDTKTGLRLTLVGNFFANFQVNYQWDNTPSPGNNRNDTDYLMGLGYSFDN